MKKLSIYISTILFLFSSTGCALFSNMFTKQHGELTKRYEKSTEDRTTSIDNYVAVDGYAFEPTKASAPKPPLVYQLPETIVRKLVSAFYWKDNTSADIIKSLSSPLTVAKEAGDPDFVMDDRTTFSKRLIFSIRNKSFYPADRIWKLNVELKKPTTTPIRFLSSSVLATEFANVDLGKLSFNRKSSFDAGLNAGTGVTLSQGNNTTDVSGTENNSETNGSATDDKSTTGSSVKNTTSGSTTKENKSSNTIENKIGGNVGFKNEFSSNEEVALKQRYVKLTGTAKANSVSVYQESTSGIDLSGSVIADVDFGPVNSTANSVAVQMAFEFKKLKTAAAFTPVAAIGLKTIVVAYPSVSVDLYGVITFDGVLRKVTKRDNTIAESDDVVTFVGGPSTYVSDSILLLSKREMVPNFWHIVNAAGSPIQIKTVALNAPVDLVFRSYDDALNFITWLKAQKAIVPASGVIGGNIEISMGVGVAAGLTPAKIDGMSIQIR